MEITKLDNSLIDSLTNKIVTIDQTHHEIHDGKHFVVNYAAGAKNDGTTINIYMKTPGAHKRAHAFFSWAASGAAYGRIQEGPTITANTGTNAQVIYNSDRNSTITSQMLDNATTPAANRFGYDVTVTGAGATIYSEFSGVAKSSAGFGRSETEFILKPDTVYIFVVESDATSLTLYANVAWYEE